MKKGREKEHGIKKLSSKKVSMFYIRFTTVITEGTPLQSVL